MHCWVAFFLPQVKLNHVLGMWNPPHHSRVGCHELGWAYFHVATVISYLTHSLKNWISEVVVV